nr:MAG TPA: tail protein [Caudoviricetes sp.]
MNIKFVNLETKDVLSISNEPFSEYFLGKLNIEPITGSASTTRYIDLIGLNVDSVTLAERDIEVSGIITVENSFEIKDRITKLKKFFNPQKKYMMEIDKYTIGFMPRSTVKDDYLKSGPYHSRFWLVGTAYDPLFRLKKDKIVQEAKIKPTVLFPLKIRKKGISFGYISAESIENVINQGDVDVGFVLKIDASKGEVTNPKLTNNNTGEFIELILQMSQGDKIEISTESGNKYAYLIRGSSRIDIFKYVTTASTMSMKLAKGRNNISITAKGNTVNMEAKITYSPRFLEI